MKKVSWSGVASLAVTLIGVACSPVVLNVLSPKWAAAVSLAGGLAQAITPAVHKGESTVQ